MPGKFFLRYGGKCWMLLTTALVAGTFSITPAYSKTVDPQATPTGETVASGEATFDRPTPGQLNINQISNRAIINWDSFDIGEQATTQFNQPATKSLAVNRVTRQGSDPTQILGKLNANGNIMILDRNGVLFGENAVVDVGGIIASTGDVLDDDITDGNGQLKITGIGPGTIENKGTITVADFGLAALVAPTVRNSGIINANTGKVNLGAGTVTTVDFFGDDLISMEVNDATQQTVIDNAGRINAQGGTVSLTTAAADNIVNNVVNTGGVVNATSATINGTKIVLTGTPSVDTGTTGIDLGSSDINVSRSATGNTVSLTDVANVATSPNPPTANEANSAGAEIPPSNATDNSVASNLTNAPAGSEIPPTSGSTAATSLPKNNLVPSTNPAVLADLQNQAGAEIPSTPGLITSPNLTGTGVADTSGLLTGASPTPSQTNTGDQGTLAQNLGNTTNTTGPLTQ